MSIYATIADLRAVIAERDLIQLTDDAATGTVDATWVAKALDQADNEINGYVAAYYRRADAAAPVPGLLTDLACDIAHYRLFRHGSPTERVQKLYDAAISRLRDIAKGTIKLDLGEETLPERGGQILVESADRTFTRDTMRGL